MEGSSPSVALGASSPQSLEKLRLVAPLSTLLLCLQAQGSGPELSILKGTVALSSETGSHLHWASSFPDPLPSRVMEDDVWEVKMVIDSSTY